MSNITRWDPLRDLLTMRDAMDRLFDTAWPTPSAAWSPAWNLALDVAEGADEFVVKATVPGIDPDDLEVTYNDRTLTIKGEVKAEKKDEQANYLLRERRYGSFTRSVTLPAAIKADAIEASYEAGILTLRLPKAEEARPRRITVHAGSKMIEG
jgi:HSP20 family protein